MSISTGLSSDFEQQSKESLAPSVKSLINPQSEQFSLGSSISTATYPSIIVTPILSFLNNQSLDQSHQCFRAFGGTPNTNNPLSVVSTSGLNGNSALKCLSTTGAFLQCVCIAHLENFLHQNTDSEWEKYIDLLGELQKERRSLRVLDGTHRICLASESALRNAFIILLNAKNSPDLNQKLFYRFLELLESDPQLKKSLADFLREIIVRRCEMNSNSEFRQTIFSDWMGSLDGSSNNNQAQIPTINSNNTDCNQKMNEMLKLLAFTLNISITLTFTSSAPNSQHPQQIQVGNPVNPNMCILITYQNPTKSMLNFHYISLNQHSQLLQSQKQLQPSIILNPQKQIDYQIEESQKIMLPTPLFERPQQQNNDSPNTCEHVPFEQSSTKNRAMNVGSAFKGDQEPITPEYIEESAEKVLLPTASSKGVHAVSEFNSYNYQRLRDRIIATYTLMEVNSIRINTNFESLLNPIPPSTQQSLQEQPQITIPLPKPSIPVIDVPQPLSLKQITSGITPTSNNSINNSVSSNINRSRWGPLDNIQMMMIPAGGLPPTASSVTNAATNIGGTRSPPPRSLIHFKTIPVVVQQFTINQNSQQQQQKPPQQSQQQQPQLQQMQQQQHQQQIQQQPQQLLILKQSSEAERKSTSKGVSLVRHLNSVQHYENLPTTAPVASAAISAVVVPQQAQHRCVSPPKLTQPPSRETFARSASIQDHQSRTVIIDRNMHINKINKMTSPNLLKLNSSPLQEIIPRQQCINSSVQASAVTAAGATTTTTTSTSFCREGQNNQSMINILGKKNNRNSMNISSSAQKKAAVSVSVSGAAAAGTTMTTAVSIIGNTNGTNSASAKKSINAIKRTIPDQQIASPIKGISLLTSVGRYQSAQNSPSRVPLIAGNQKNI